VWLPLEVEVSDTDAEEVKLGGNVPEADMEKKVEGESKLGPLE
jgi:hypothetical protein